MCVRIIWSFVIGFLWILTSACGGDATSGASPEDSSGSREGDDDDSDTSTSQQTGSDGPLEPINCGVWAEGTAANDDGITRDFYNRAAGLAWTNIMGDWTDATGADQGTAPFATVGVSDNNTPEWYSWDVLSLVQGWADGTWPNKGFVLLADGGPFDFASKEHAQAGERPELVVESSLGTDSFEPAADAHVNSSTYQGFGDEVTLRVGTDSNVFLRFDLTSLDGADVTSATLRLYKLQDYGGGTVDVDVFRSSHGYDRQGVQPTLGLAAAFPGDQSIETHGSVLMFSDFEGSNWKDVWTSVDDRPTLSPVDGSEANGFEAFDGSALRVQVASGNNYGGSLIYKYLDEQGQEPEEGYFRYYLRIGEDWNPTDGGKMPGFSGTYGVAGWGGRPVDGTDGWSARGTYRTVVPDGNPLERHSAIGNYVYHADMPGSYGDVDLWLQGCGGLLDKNRWYSVETYLKLNTPGENDGILRGWVDGRLVYERIDWRWRDVNTLKIEQAWMNFYHGGTATPPTDLHLYIDNVVVATEYIGPMGETD